MNLVLPSSVYNLDAEVFCYILQQKVASQKKGLIKKLQMLVKVAELKIVNCLYILLLWPFKRQYFAFSCPEFSDFFKFNALYMSISLFVCLFVF